MSGRGLLDEILAVVEFGFEGALGAFKPFRAPSGKGCVAHLPCHDLTSLAYSPLVGSASPEKVLAQLLLYRHGLNAEEKALYDEQILNGWHPSQAAETLRQMRATGLILAEKSLVLSNAF